VAASTNVPFTPEAASDGSAKANNSKRESFIRISSLIL